MTRMLKRWLGAEDGWGAATGLILLLGFGVFVLFVSVADLREAARIVPEERTCESWLADPSGARWVKLTGCKLDLSAAASRKWKGWLSLRDGGVSGEKYLELFIPIGVRETDEPPRAVLATSDAALLKLVDGIEATPPDQLETYLKEHRAEFESLLSPETLTGYVEPVKSLAARTALSAIATEDAVVLEQGRQPPRVNALFGVIVGLFCIAVGVRSIARRALVDRDSST
jgi:hypothetical protein